MPYNADTTWDTIINGIQSRAKVLIEVTQNGGELYKEWLSFRDGRTNADIATYFTNAGRTTTEAEVTDLDNCFSAMLDQHSYADNGASPYQRDRYAALRKFTAW